MAQSASAGEPVTVLTVAARGDLARLDSILGHSRWTLLGAATLTEARALLRRLPSVVLICEAVLPDGTWRDLLQYTLHLPVPPPVIVTADQADDYLWMEVLNGGGYNVLGKPFSEQEVYRMVSTAWLHRLDMAHAGARAAGAG